MEQAINISNLDIKNLISSQISNSQEAKSIASLVDGAFKQNQNNPALNQALASIVAQTQQAVSGQNGVNLLSTALTGKPASALSAQESFMLNSLVRAIINGDIKPDLSEGSFSDPAVRGVFVPKGNGQGEIILSSDRPAKEAATETLLEEFGEAIANFAKSRGLDLQPGDAGARLAALISGKPITDDMTKPQGDDTVDVSVTFASGETKDVSGAARTKQVEGTQGDDVIYANEPNVSYNTLAGDDVIHAIPGQTHGLLDGDHGNDKVVLQNITPGQVRIQQIGDNITRVYLRDTNGSFYEAGGTTQLFTLKNIEKVTFGATGETVSFKDFVANSKRI